MKICSEIHLGDVKNVYGGPEGDIWELLMGEQVHIGGFLSSTELAEKAGIGKGQSGVDMCCCTGAGMRFLVKFRGVAHMTGVDATARVITRGMERDVLAGVDKQLSFINADVCASGLPSDSADFVWGEDAWCYVEDKVKLISEAVRIVKKGGVIAFTDWVEGQMLGDAEALEYLKFMKFPSIFTIPEYVDCLKKNGCEIVQAYDTGRFAPYAQMYIEYATKQLSFDILRTIGFNVDVLAGLGNGLQMVAGLAKSGKIAQGLIIARKK